MMHNAVRHNSIHLSTAYLMLVLTTCVFLPPVFHVPSALDCDVLCFLLDCPNDSNIKK